MLVGFTYSDASRWSNGPSPHLIIVGSLIQTDLSIGTVHAGSMDHIWGKPLFLHPLWNFQPSQTTPYHCLHLSGVRSGGYVHCHNWAEELGGITVWAQRVPQTTRGAPALSASNSGRKGASRPYKHLHLLLVCW